jgi:hypothetical protein
MNMASADPKQTAMDYTSTSNLLISRLSKGGRSKRRNKTNINFKKKYSNFKKFQSIRNLKKIKFHTRSRRRGKNYQGGATAPNIPFVHLSPNGGALQETGNAFEVSKNTALEQSKYDNTAVFKK